MPVEYPKPLAGTFITAGAGAATNPTGGVSTVPFKPVTPATNVSAHAFAKETDDWQKYWDVIKLSSPTDMENIKTATAMLDADIRRTWLEDYINDLSVGVTSQEANNRLFNKLRDHRGNANPVLPLTPYLSEQTSSGLQKLGVGKGTADTLGQSIFPQTLEELAVSAFFPAKAGLAAIKAGGLTARSGAGILARESFEETAEGVGAGLAMTGAEALGAGENAQFAAGFVGGLGGNLAASFRPRGKGFGDTYLEPDDSDFTDAFGRPVREIIYEADAARAGVEPGQIEEWRAALLRGEDIETEDATISVQDGSYILRYKYDNDTNEIDLITDDIEEVLDHLSDAGLSGIVSFKNGHIYSVSKRDQAYSVEEPDGSLEFFDNPDQVIKHIADLEGYKPTKFTPKRPPFTQNIMGEEPLDPAVEAMAFGTDDVLADGDSLVRELRTGRTVTFEDGSIAYKEGNEYLWESAGGAGSRETARFTDPHELASRAEGYGLIGEKLPPSSQEMQAKETFRRAMSDDVDSDRTLFGQSFESTVDNLQESLDYRPSDKTTTDVERLTGTNDEIEYRIKDYGDGTYELSGTHHQVKGFERVEGTEEPIEFRGTLEDIAKQLHARYGVGGEDVDSSITGGTSGGYRYIDASPEQIRENIKGLYKQLSEYEDLAEGSGSVVKVYDGTGRLIDNFGSIDNFKKVFLEDMHPDDVDFYTKQLKSNGSVSLPLGSSARIESASMDRASAERNIQETFNEIRQAQDWLDFHTNPNYDGPLKGVSGIEPYWRQQGDQGGQQRMSDYGVGGGAVAGIPGPRDIMDVVREAVAPAGRVGRKVLSALGINKIPETMPARFEVARQLLDIERDGIVEATIAARWDRIATTSGGRDVLQLNARQLIKAVYNDGTTDMLPWHKIFERPQDFNLNKMGLKGIGPLVEEFHRIVHDVLEMEAAYGLPPRNFEEVLEEALYVPRQVLEARGTEMERASRSDLPRRYADIVEAVREHGVVYADPRTTLEIFMRQTVNRINSKQFEDALAPWGPRPVEFIPEDVRVGMLKARQELKKAGQAMRREAKSTQTALRQMATKDMRLAESQVQQAKRQLARVRGELNGRRQLASGRRQSPVSFGRRLAEAKGRLFAAEQILEDAKLNMKAVPKGAAGVKKLITQKSVDDVKAKAKEYRLWRARYQRHLEAVQADKGGGTASPAYWKPEVIATRGAWRKAEAEWEKAKAQEIRNGRNPRQSPVVKSLRDSMRKLENEHWAALREAKKNSMNDSPIAIDDWKQKFFPAEDVRRIEEGVRRYAESDTGVSDWLNRFANTRRTAQSGFDFGAPFIHLAPMIVVQPRAWAKATLANVRAVFDLQVGKQFIQQNYDYVIEMAQYQVPVGKPEFFASLERGGGISIKPIYEAAFGKDAALGIHRTLGQIGRQTIGRMQHGMDTALLIARTEFWKAHRNLPEYKNNLPELARMTRNLTGGIDQRALGISTKQRSFEAMWVAYSPKLLRSTLALFAEVPQAFVRSKGMIWKDPNGMMAVRGLAGLGMVTAAMYVMVGAALGKSEKEILEGLNPLNGKKFLSHKIFGQWIGPGGQIRSVMQLLTGIYSAASPDEIDATRLLGGEGKSFRDLFSWDSFENPLLSWGLNRGAPGQDIFRTFGEGVTGANMQPFAQVDGMPDAFLHLGYDSFPFAMQALLEGANLGALTFESQGWRTSPETPVEARVETIEDEVIPELISQGVLPEGASLDNLGFGEYDAVGRYLKEHRPDLVESYEGWLNDINSVSQRIADRRKEIEEEFRPTFDRLYADLLSGKQDAREVQRQLTSARDQLRGQIEELYSDPDYQKFISDLDQNDLQKLADDYFNIIDEVAQGEKVLTPEQWDEVTKLQDQFILDLNKRDSALAARFKNDLDLRDSVIGAHPIIKLKREVDNASEAYYNLPEEARDDYLKAHPELNVKRWVFYGGSLKSMEAVDMALLKQGEGLAGEAMKASVFDLPVRLEGFARRIDKDVTSWDKHKKFIQLYNDIPSQYKQRIRRDVPQLDAIMVYWGNSTRLQSGEGVAALNTLMSRTGWEYWGEFGGIISAVMMLPTTSITGEDQAHLRSQIPAVDAIINLWREFMFEEEPAFVSEEGRAAFFRLTGRNVGDLAVTPIEE